MRRDGAVAHLLLHTVGKQLDQAHPPRHPTRAAIKTARKSLQLVAEALLQFNQQPALFQRRRPAVSRRTPVACSIRRRGQPKRPSAITCSRFSLLKTLPMLTEANFPPRS